MRGGVTHAAASAGASAATRQAVSRAEKPEQAYALLILSPEFQRR